MRHHARPPRGRHRQAAPRRRHRPGAVFARRFQPRRRTPDGDRVGARPAQRRRSAAVRGRAACHPAVPRHQQRRHGIGSASLRCQRVTAAGRAGRARHQGRDQEHELVSGDSPRNRVRDRAAIRGPRQWRPARPGAPGVDPGRGPDGLAGAQGVARSLPILPGPGPAAVRSQPKLGGGDPRQPAGTAGRAPATVRDSLWPHALRRLAADLVQADGRLFRGDRPAGCSGQGGRQLDPRRLQPAAQCRPERDRTLIGQAGALAGADPADRLRCHQRQNGQGDIRNHVPRARSGAGADGAQGLQPDQWRRRAGGHRRPGHRRKRPVCGGLQGRKGTGLEIPDRPGDEDLQRPGQPAAARSIAPSEDRIVELTVGELAHGGAAVARVDGRVVFVEGAIPGETVEAEVTHRRKDFWRAQATAVLDPAATRVDPPCPYFKAGCGGCQLQYLAYPEQLAQKQQVLHRQLERAHLGFPLDRIDILGMDDPWRYRIRGEFHVLHHGGAVSLGFYRKHTYQTLPIDACLIHAEAIERALPAFARAAEDPAAARVTALQFTWAPGTSDLLWAPYPPGSADPGFGARAAGWIPELNLNDDSIGIDDAGRHFRVRPEAFVQVNARQREVLYQRAVAFARLRGGDRAVDAYAGIGMLTTRLAEHAADVIAVEESPYAVRLGELNMQLNSCGNVQYRRGRVEDALGQIEGPIEVLVLDPPRAGCAETAVEAMANLRAERMIYISCDPATLARDVGRFCAAGRYTLVEVAFVDMFQIGR